MVIEIKKETSINGIVIAWTQSWKELVNRRVGLRESHSIEIQTLKDQVIGMKAGTKSL